MWSDWSEDGGIDNRQHDVRTLSHRDESALRQVRQTTMAYGDDTLYIEYTDYLAAAYARLINTC
jgi:hypothetical protein